MRLVIVGHPVRRMAERGITEDDILSALRNNHSSWTTRDGSIQYVGPGVDGRNLIVWTLPAELSEEATITIKSIAWR